MYFLKLSRIHNLSQFSGYGSQAGKRTSSSLASFILKVFSMNVFETTINRYLANNNNSEFSLTNI